MNHRTEADSNEDQRTRPQLPSLLSEASVFIRDNDEPGLRRYLQRSTSVGELAGVLAGEDSVASWIAAYCLGAIGGPISVMPLARTLHHDDPAVVASAEDALWRIWFEEGGVAGRRHLQRAADEMESGRYDAAIAILDDVIARQPSFAECFHQRSIARCLADDSCGAIADARRAIEFNRCHFGAWAGLGHAYVNIRQYHDAMQAYRTALSIHPRLEGVRQAISKIQTFVRGSSIVA
jgi:tetratricopeptide (TPR) repeat protein